MWLLLLLAATAAPALAIIDLEPPLPPRASSAEPVEGWLTVRLNQFKASDTGTFRMRYYYNDEFASRGNIVIFVGGEWEIHPQWTVGGLAHEIAEATGAALFYTEHRYYGATRPTAETTTEDLRYLNVDQSLADLAQFIQYVKSDSFEDGKYRNGSVGLVGCSYAGSMATWMRRGYPHLVDAAFSDSGPLHAQEDFPEYLEVVTEALRSQGGEECVAAVEEAMEQLTSRLAAGQAQAVSDMFNTCSTIQTGAPLDLASFFWGGVIATFAGLVQSATPGDIERACAVLTNADVADPVQRLASWVTSQAWTQPCIETRYSEIVAETTNTSYDAPHSVMRLWRYQTCIEYGWYQTTSSPNQAFHSTVPLEYFHQMCRDIYSSYFNETLLRAGISRTNLLFGGLSLPERVVSVAGGLDPWAPMGPRAEHATPRAPVYVVPSVSHCRAIQSTATSETAELDRVKRAVIGHVVEWMTGERSAAAAPISMGLLVSLGVLLQLYLLFVNEGLVRRFNIMFFSNLK